jgi:hypothetical protein
MEQDLELLRNFEESSKWFHNHLNSLREQGFSGKFVAIKESKPLTSEENLDNLIKNVEKKGEDPAFIFMEFVHPKGYTLIL